MKREESKKLEGPMFGSAAPQAELAGSAEQARNPLLAGHGVM